MKLKIMRLIAGYTQKQAAEKLKISVRTLQRFESKKTRELKIQDALKLVNFYGFAIKELED